MSTHTIFDENSTADSWHIPPQPTTHPPISSWGLGFEVADYDQLMFSSENPIRQVVQVWVRLRVMGGRLGWNIVCIIHIPTSCVNNFTPYFFDLSGEYLIPAVVLASVYWILWDRHTFRPINKAGRLEVWERVRHNQKTNFNPYTSRCQPKGTSTTTALMGGLYSSLRPVHAVTTKDRTHVNH